MSNHFHLLVTVPEKIAADNALAFEHFIIRVRGLYGEKVAAELQFGGSPVSEEQRRARDAELAVHRARMHDLSVFMKLLKQRFTMWHNHRLETKGTLWTERFKSVVVEARGGVGNPAGLVAAYIDLNPVRAGVVAEAKDYPYSGCGSASMGNEQSQRGLQVLDGTDSGDEGSYRHLVDGRWAEETSDAASPSVASALRCRQAAFVKSVILGSAAFVMGVVEAMIEIRRSLRPQAYATGGLGESLWVGGRFRRE